MKIVSSPTTADKTVAADVSSNNNSVSFTTNDKTTEDSQVAAKNDAAAKDNNDKKLFFSFSSLKTETFDAGAVTGKLVIHDDACSIPSGDNDNSKDDQDPAITGTLTYDGQDLAMTGTLTCVEKNGDAEDDDTADSKKKVWVMHLGCKWLADEKKFVPFVATTTSDDGGSEADNKDTDGQGVMTNETFLDLVNGDTDGDKKQATLEFFNKKEGSGDEPEEKPFLVLVLQRDEQASSDDAANKGTFLFSLLGLLQQGVVVAVLSYVWHSFLFSIYPLSTDDGDKPEEVEKSEEAEKSEDSSETKDDEASTEKKKDDNPSPPKKAKVDGEDDEAEAKDGEEKTDDSA